MSETSSDRTAAAAISSAEKSDPQAKAGADGREDSPARARHGKNKMTHEEKEAARTGWRSEVQEIPKQVSAR